MSAITKIIVGTPIKKKVPVKIRIERVEGLAHECVTRTVGSYEMADAVLAKWARTAPQGGGYDKCDFLVTFEDGETYEGRYDLFHISKGPPPPDLAKHMRQHVAFFAGSWRPSHLTEAEYARILASVEERTPGSIETHAVFEAKYDLGGR